MSLMLARRARMKPAAPPAVTVTKVASGSSTLSNAASKSVTLPAVQDGDVIFIWGGVANSTGTALRDITSGPAGYTTPGQQQKASSTRAVTAQLFYKTAVAATDTGSTITLNFSASDLSWVQYVIYRGTSTTFRAGPTFSTATGSLTYTVPVLTAAAAARGLVCIASVVGGYFSSDLVMSGVTEFENPAVNSTSVNTSEYSMADAGDSPAITATRSANNTNCAWVGCNVLMAA